MSDPLEEKELFEGFTADIELVARLACCQRNFAVLQDIMKELSQEELKYLRTYIREYYKVEHLHHELEYRFNLLIVEETENEQED